MSDEDLASLGPGDDVGRGTTFVLDTESIPDGRLLGLTKFAGQGLDPEEAIRRAQAEARELSRTGSDFLPVTFQVPVAVCIARVNQRFELTRLTCLDAPHFRPPEIVRAFWNGLARFPKAKLVTFNGRGFDLPLLELAAFRYGYSARDYYQNRNRYSGNHLDLMEWLTNFGAFRMAGGIDLLSKLLGKPGKMGVCGDQVYELYREGKVRQINDYCIHDTLDTYFVYLRTCVLKGEIDLEREHELVVRAKEWLTGRVSETPALQEYLANWGDWSPWP